MLLRFVLHHSTDCSLHFMNDLGLDEVHTTFLDQWLVSFAMLQEVLPHEVCFNSIFAQVTDTQDRFCHVWHMKLISFQMISKILNQICLFLKPWSALPSAPRSRTEPSDCSRADSPNHLGQTLTDASLSIITNASS